MKVRLGVLTGSPAGNEGSGAYFAFDDTREGVKGLRGIYYCTAGGEVGRDARLVRIYPGEGQCRVTGLRLRMDEGTADMVRRFGLATEDFTRPGSFLRLTVGKRVWLRNATRLDVVWQAASRELLFQDNKGPLADSLLRGDYVQIEVGMAAREDVYTTGDGEDFVVERPWSDDEYPQVLTQFGGAFAPVTTCDVYVGADWNDDGFACAAGVMNEDGSWLAHAQAYTLSTKKKKKSSSRNVGQEVELRGVTGGPFTVWLMGDRKHAKVTVSFPAGSLGVTAQILDIYVQQ